MKTVELIHKLSELGRLVEIWEEPTMQDCFNLGWRQNSKSKYLFFIRGGEVKKDISPRDIFNHICTQKAFKAEVRKVAGELKVLDKHCDPKFYTLDFNKNILKLSFDELFKRLLGDINTSLHASQLLIAICHKMGVELESEEK